MKFLPLNKSGAPWRKPAAVTLLAIVICALVVAQVKYVNGSWYWVWPWRDWNLLPPARWYGWMSLAAVPLIAAWWMRGTSRRSTALTLILLMLGAGALKLMAMAVLTRPMSFAAIDGAVQSPVITSYYTDASALVNFENWLATYAEILPRTQLHTQSKPPGAVAFFAMFIEWFGAGSRGAIAAGATLSLLAMLSVPFVYWLARILNLDRPTAMIAATLMALCPGIVLISPTFDAVFPVCACAMIGFWHVALTRNDLRAALALGAVLSVTCFFTYNLLVLGALMLAWPIMLRAGARRTLKHACIAGGTVIAIYFALWLATYFDPIATFRSAWKNQHALLAAHREDRPYPWTILFDLLDFALGGGWIVLIPAVLAIRSRWRVMVLLMLGQPVLVAMTGLLQSETARVWNFMLPLLVIPAAIEMQSWPGRERRTFYAAALLIVLVVGHNMSFMI